MSADDEVSAPGRRPPPRRSRFQKGLSGNPAGRPKGAISIKKLTTKFALGKLKINVNGRSELKSRLEIAILKLIALAADGKGAAVEELQRLRLKAAPAQMPGGLLVVPEPLPLDEYIAKTQEENKDAIVPDTEIDPSIEDLVRSPEKSATEYDRALLAHRQKYGR